MSKWLILVSITIVISIIIIYGSYFKSGCRVVQVNTYLIMTNQTNIISNTSYIHPMFKDPDANECYSLKSLSMPEEIIDLNAVSFNRQRINASLAPENVTFNQVHSILYGDPSSKLIYQYAKKYFNKKFDSSYPNTNLGANDFIQIIRKIDPSLKVQFVVEIGSFTGNSASLIGQVLKSAYPGSFLLCIDTWVGGM